MTVDELLEDLLDEVVALWGAGLALPGPDRAERLRELGRALQQQALSRPAARLDRLASHLEEGALPEAWLELQAVTAWARTFRLGWSLHRARDALVVRPEVAARPAPGPAGLRLRIEPVGIEVAGARWLVHAVSEAGEPVVLRDDISDVTEDAPLTRPVSSTLFQDRVVYGAVLTHALVLRDHPPTRTGGTTVFAPSFYTRPQVLGEASRGRERLPGEGARVRRGLLLRAELLPRRTADGWRIEHDGGDLALVVEEVLALNLEKWTALGDAPLDAVLLGRSEGISLLEMLDPLGRPCFPTVDPRAVRWPPRRVVEAIHDDEDAGWGLLACGLEGRAKETPTTPCGVVARWLVEGVPEPAAWPAEEDGEAIHLALWTRWVADAPLPSMLQDRLSQPARSSSPSLEEVAARALFVGGAPGQALAEAHAASLRKGVAASGVLPGVYGLWALADAIVRLRGNDPREEPLRVLDLPPLTVWSAATSSLGAHLQGRAGDLEVIEALLLVRLAGAAGVLWQD